jgi:diaminopimelate dehydrogenase
VNIANITYGGKGEQWKMVYDNIEQSQLFFNVLSVVDSIATLSVAGFNNYLDENPASTAHYVFESGIYTVDCFDIHEELAGMRSRMQSLAENGKVSCIIGAGWDPGLDSVIRTLMSAAFPKGEIYTNFGPGMSMGHSAAVKSVNGVRDSVSLTLPLGNGKHMRKIYVAAEENADKAAIEHAILFDGYFEHDRCSIEFVEDVMQFFNTKHGVFIENIYGDQKMDFSMKIDNPTLTGNILASAMGAAFKQKSGAYFMPEIPPCDFCREEWKKYL